MISANILFACILPLYAQNNEDMYEHITERLEAKYMKDIESLVDKLGIFVHMLSLLDDEILVALLPCQHLQQ
jgi:hypothetical protein